MSFWTRLAEVLAKSYDVLKPGGRLVTIAGQPDEELAREKGITASMVKMSANVEQLAAIANLVSEGKVCGNIYII
jgi:hypothetical protein